MVVDVMMNKKKNCENLANILFPSVNFELKVLINADNLTYFNLL
jgi:hypothetical protein